MAAAALNNAEIFPTNLCTRCNVCLSECASVCVCVDKFFDNSITVLIKLQACNRKEKNTHTHTKFFNDVDAVLLITIIRFEMASTLFAL